MQTVSAMRLRTVKLAFTQSMLLAYFDFSNLMPSLERASYNSLTSKMILHFLPSKVHDAAASSFGRMMASSLNSLLFNQPNPQYKLRGNTSASFSSYFNYGSSYISHTAFHLPNGFKEPDMYIFPVTRVREDPTLVLEVGYSERMSEWRQDAKRWLLRTPAVRFSAQLG